MLGVRFLAQRNLQTVKLSTLSCQSSPEAAIFQILFRLSRFNKGCGSPRLISCFCLEHTLRSSAWRGVHTYLQAS